MFTADMQLTNKIEPRMPREQVLWKGQERKGEKYTVGSDWVDLPKYYQREAA